MATLTIRNVPDDLYQRLQERARRNRRSLNQEVVMALESSNEDSSGRMARLRHFHETVTRGRFRASPEEIDAFIDEGHE